MASSAPRYAEAPAALATLANAKPRAGIETAFDVEREHLVEVLRTLRDQHEYQQLMEIAGVDYPDRAERFEVVYCLLSLTRNHRVRIHVSTDESTSVPSVTSLWPVAGWLEREVFDMYGVSFAGNSDLRRILTDYGFEGYPQRKDFPLTGHVEMRYSEAEKRVVYEPVDLPQDFRTFDFLMPWQGAEYVLPGDEKAELQAPGAPTPVPATGAAPQVKPVAATEGKNREKPYAMDNEERTRAGAKEADAEAGKSAKAKAEKEVLKPAAGEAPKPKGTGRRRPTGSAG